MPDNHVHPPQVHTSKSSSRTLNHTVFFTTINPNFLKHYAKSPENPGGGRGNVCHRQAGRQHVCRSHISSEATPQALRENQIGITQARTQATCIAKASPTMSDEFERILWL